MPQKNTNRFHPKQWTAVTWLAVLLWTWTAFLGNYPSFVWYSVNPATGELSEPIRAKSLSEIPYPIGWPLHYVEPSDFSTPLPAVLVGSPAPPPIPSAVSLLAMVANLLLIVIAVFALVYLLQRIKYRFSLLFLFVVMSSYPLYFTLERLVVIISGYNAHAWYATAIYFSPIVVALADRYSLYPRFNWVFFRLKWMVLHRSFDDYDHPDDVIAAARKLDWRGDWTASINLYRRIAERWPEQAEYMQQCIDRVAEKQSLAQT